MSTTSDFLRACRREAVTRRPVWFMRQAGRSLPEYRKLREGTTMLDACRRPEMVAEITLQPVRRLGVDAAVLFSDIVVPLAAAGVDVDIQPGVGPVVAEPVRDADAVAAIRPLAEGDVDHVARAVRLLTAELGDTPLIGFAGAPFTLASYLVEGGPSRSHARTKALMHGAPDVWHALCAKLVQITVEFLRVQAVAGVSAVQLFDSWAGALSEADYRRFVAPHSAAVLSAVAEAAPELPRIHFGVGTGHLLPAMAEAGATVVGVDWRTPLDAAASVVGPDRAVQGNLDPALLFAPWPVLDAEVRRICAEGDAAAGHVFNLGHGVLPETDPDMLARVVDLVHELPPA
ncbi:MAG TPA: uroporphyrinogen decarboxylase [Actinocatenispora sp.]